MILLCQKETVYLKTCLFLDLLRVKNAYCIDIVARCEVMQVPLKNEGDSASSIVIINNKLLRSFMYFKIWYHVTLDKSQIL